MARNRVRSVDGTRIAVIPESAVGPAEGLVARVLRDSAVRKELKGRRTRVLGVRTVGDEDDKTAKRKAAAGERVTIYDYTDNRIVEVSTRAGSVVETRRAHRQPLPHPDEWRDAFAIVAADPELGPLVAGGRLHPYRAMPPLSDVANERGEIERALHVGLRPQRGSGLKHEIVRANLVRRAVERYDNHAPVTVLDSDTLCGVPEAACSPAPRGTPGTLSIAWPEDDPVWTLTAVRPAASSGTRGSGLELRQVHYLGKKVLHRAHLPILNVQYDQNLCGPYRDWIYEEWCFAANGKDVAPGFRWCTEPPVTICESGKDGGNFSGVAIHERDNALVLTTVLSADWYRYVLEWTFTRDGAIRPRIRFTATSDPCVCNAHVHHAYMRFDFDLNGLFNVVEEHNDPPIGPGPWHTIDFEVRRNRDAARDRMWRIRNRVSGEAYEIVPGPEDGTADAYGRGDFWVVRWRPPEIDDGFDSTTGPGTEADIDKFVTGENVVDQDVVVWYATHFRHNVAEDDHTGCHEVGPDLRPASCAVYETAQSGGMLRRVDALRAFRDTTMARTAAGVRITALIRRHGAEVIALMARDRRLRKLAEAALRAGIGLVPARGKEPVVTRKALDVLLELLDALEAEGSDALRADVRASRALVTDGLEKKTLADALQMLSGHDRV